MNRLTDHECMFVLIQKAGIIYRCPTGIISLLDTIVQQLYVLNIIIVFIHIQ